MKPVLDQSFWTDPDIERQKYGVKLAALWLITNPATNILGVCTASAARFTFETGLPEEALLRAMEGLPRAFKRIGDVILVKNYVRYQFGTGEKLKRNNFFVALKSAFLSIKGDELRDELLRDYPEFEGLQRGCEGVQTPSIDKSSKEKKGSAEGGDTDANWIDGLTKKDCYKAIDISAELEKAGTWCGQNNRKCTRKFFVNWINRALESNRVVSGNGARSPDHHIPSAKDLA